MLPARRERQQPKGASGAPRTQSKGVARPAAEPWAPLRSPRPGLWRVTHPISRGLFWGFARRSCLGCVGCEMSWGGLRASGGCSGRNSASLPPAYAPNCCLFLLSPSSPPGLCMHFSSPGLGFSAVGKGALGSWEVSRDCSPRNSFKLRGWGSV